jgi:hypothetical protein
MTSKDEQEQSQWINPFQTREERAEIINKLIANDPGPGTLSLRVILEKDTTGNIYVDPDGHVILVKDKLRLTREANQ